jgi:zinc/manganese transport system ATP-binding protein
MGAVVAAVVDIMSSIAVRFEDVTVRYADRAAVCGVSATIMAGSLTALIGPNGAGKSTLLNAMMGLKSASQGRIVFGPQIEGRIAYLPQQSALDRSFPITTLDLVTLGLWQRVGATGRIGGSDLKRARDALAVVGLAGVERLPIGTLSAGQLQRALFARVLLQDAQLILLDEPFNAVDARTTTDLLSVLRIWREQGRTVVAVLHDMEQVRAHFGRALLLARQCIVSGSTALVVTEDNLARARAIAEDWEAPAP